MALSEINYKINPEADLTSEIERMIVQIKQSQNKIRLKQNELETYKPEEGEEEKMSLTAQVVKLEQALNRNEINPKTTMMEKWIAMIKEVKETNEARKKSLKKE